MTVLSEPIPQSLDYWNDDSSGRNRLSNTKQDETLKDCMQTTLTISSPHPVYKLVVKDTAAAFSNTLMARGHHPSLNSPLADILCLCTRNTSHFLIGQTST